MEEGDGGRGGAKTPTRWQVANNYRSFSRSFRFKTEQIAGMDILVAVWKEFCDTHACDHDVEGLKLEEDRDGVQVS